MVFYIKDASAPFAYYRERLGEPLQATQILRLDSPPSAEQVAQWAKQYPRLWLVDFPTGPKDTVEPEISGSMAGAYHRCARGAFKAISVSWWSTTACPEKP